MLSYNVVAQIIRKCLNEDFVGAPDQPSGIQNDDLSVKLTHYWTTMVTDAFTQVANSEVEHLSGSSQIQKTPDGNVYVGSVKPLFTTILGPDDKHKPLLKTVYYSLDELYNVLAAVAAGKLTIATSPNPLANFIQTAIRDDLRFVYPHCVMRRSMAQNRYAGAIGGGIYRKFVRQSDDRTAASPLVKYLGPSAWLDGLSKIALYRLSMDHSNLVPRTTRETMVRRTERDEPVPVIVGTHEHNMAYVFEIGYRTMNAQVFGRIAGGPISKRGQHGAEFCLLNGIFSVWSVINTLNEVKRGLSYSDRNTFTTPLRVLTSKGAVPSWWFLGNAYISGSILGFASELEKDENLRKCMQYGKNVVGNFRDYSLYLTNGDASYSTDIRDVDVNTVVRHEVRCVADGRLNAYAVYDSGDASIYNKTYWKFLRRRSGEGVGDFYPDHATLPPALNLSDLEMNFVRGSRLGQRQYAVDSSDSVRGSKKLRYDIRAIFEVC